MRRLAVLLAVTTAIFALTTAYYSRQLFLARNAPVADAGAGSGVAAQISDDSAKAVLPAASGTEAASAMTKSNSDPRHSLGPYQLAILTKMRDPTARLGLVEEQKASLRRTSPYLAEYLQLGSNEFDDFLELVAAQRIATYEHTLSCMQDPACEDFQTESAKQETLIQEIARGFGVEKAQRYEHYLETSEERTYVAEMRGALPDSQRLTDTQAETLIEALADERVRIGDEITARSQTAGTTLEGVPFLLHPGATIATLMEQANEFFRRMRERAARVLTTEQLAAFDRMQAERLRRLPYMLGSMGKFPDAPKT